MSNVKENGPFFCCWRSISLFLFLLTYICSFYCSVKNSHFLVKAAESKLQSPSMLLLHSVTVFLGKSEGSLNTRSSGTPHSGGLSMLLAIKALVEYVLLKTPEYAAEWKPLALSLFACLLCVLNTDKLRYSWPGQRKVADFIQWPKSKVFFFFLQYKGAVFSKGVIVLWKM